VPWRNTTGAVAPPSASSSAEIFVVVVVVVVVVLSLAQNERWQWGHCQVEKGLYPSDDAAAGEIMLLLP